MISMNYPIIMEKIMTPKRSPKAMKSLSMLLLGLISPKPTVVRDVNEK
jgi:hypothetical protein